MPPHSLRLVLDTNVLLAGLVSESSASQKVLEAVQTRKVVVLLSPQVLAEYRTILLHPAIAARFAQLTPRRVELALRRLRYLGDEYRAVRVKFQLERDPRDAMFVELAIAGEATHVVTMDRDLLSLPTVRTSAGKRFRQRLRSVTVQTPQGFVEAWGDVLVL